MTLVTGIDPGVHTGFATWDATAGRLLSVQTLPIHVAMATVRFDMPALVVFEDARRRQWFGNSGREKLQGAGSVKRDSKIWEDFLTDLGVPFVMKAPASGNSKWKSDRFQTVTKWQERCSEHARDAALLVYGMNLSMVQGLIRQGEQHRGRQGNRKAG